MKLKNAPARKMQRQIAANMRNGAIYAGNGLNLIEQARAIRTKKHRAPRASF